MTLDALVALSFVLGTLVAQNAPEQRHTWERISYPPIAVGGETSESFTVVVGSGRGDEDERLRFDVLMTTINEPSARPRPPSFLGSGDEVAVRLHTGDRVIEPEPELGRGWIGTGSRHSTNWSLIFAFPWQDNALDEAWFELAGPTRTWWVEVPYGCVRSQKALLATEPDDRGVPKFAPAMTPLETNDVLVPWNDVEYDAGEIGGVQGPFGGASRLSVRLSNPFDATCELLLYGVRDLRRPVAEVVLSGKRGHTTAIRYVEPSLSRVDTFKFDRSPGEGREWGMLTISIGQSRHELVVPSSLFRYTHGCAEPHHPARLQR